MYIVCVTTNLSVQGNNWIKKGVIPESMGMTPLIFIEVILFLIYL